MVLFKLQNVFETPFVRGVNLIGDSIGPALNFIRDNNIALMILIFSYSVFSFINNFFLGVHYQAASFVLYLIVASLVHWSLMLAYFRYRFFSEDLARTPLLNLVVPEGGVFMRQLFRAGTVGLLPFLIAVIVAFAVLYLISGGVITGSQAVLAGITIGCTVVAGVALLYGVIIACKTIPLLVESARGTRLDYRSSARLLKGNIMMTLSALVFGSGVVSLVTSVTRVSGLSLPFMLEAAILFFGDMIFMVFFSAIVFRIHEVLGDRAK